MSTLAQSSIVIRMKRVFSDKSKTQTDVCLEHQNIQKFQTIMKQNNKLLHDMCGVGE